MKARPNKLDPFAARLDEWEREGKTLAQMQAGLLEDGCRVALSSISDYLAHRRQERAEQEMFALIASGAQMNRKLDTAFEQNPAPQVERLIEISKSLVMSLQVNGKANPKLLQLANNTLAMVLEYVSGKTKAEISREKLSQGDRRLKVLESKVREARDEMAKLRDPKQELGDADRKAIVEKVDEILGLK
ncbi:MAG: hypothetical protein ABFD89_05230 [Bryobacteraceae bacterium]